MYKIFKAVSKNTIIAVVLVLMICMAAYLNYVYKKPGANKQAINNNVKSTKQSEMHSGDKATMAASSYFAAERMQKEKERDKVLNYLKKLIDDKATKPEEKKTLTTKYMLLAEFNDKEKNIERTLKANGFKDVIVTLSGNSDNNIAANVIVGEDKIDTQKEVQIEDAVMSEANVSDFSKIRIIPYANED